jgi:NAD(P)-dependent dehydrogenase (short-subunit alcohol dehydrogenase family)
MKKEIEETPMGRLAQMEEIADSIVFLASPMSSFMCGTGMVVDGGFTAK